MEILATIPMHLSAFRIEMRQQPLTAATTTIITKTMPIAYETDELFHEVFVHKLKIHF